jgi:hypothetical protein
MPLGPAFEGYTGGSHVPRDKRGERYTTVSCTARREESQQSFA